MAGTHATRFSADKQRLNALIGHTLKKGYGGQPLIIIKIIGSTNTTISPINSLNVILIGYRIIDLQIFFFRNQRQGFSIVWLRTKSHNITRYWGRRWAKAANENLGDLMPEPQQQIFLPSSTKNLGVNTSLDKDPGKFPRGASCHCFVFRK